MPILRGEIYFVELGPTRGKELDDKRRPCVVLSTNIINQKPLVVTIIPGTTYKAGKPVFKNQVRVEPSSENGLQYATLFDCMQIKALDHDRFHSNPVGVLSPDCFSQVENAVKLCLGLT